MISNDLSQAIQRHWHTAVALSDDLYAHPEIAHQEFRSSQKVVELLRQAGYQVEYPYMGYPTAFRGVLKNGEGPSAAILVEYDALPGLGHACGHNAHCAMAVLAALALAEAGCTGAEIRQELEQSALDSVIYIGVETLEYLRRGGRVTPAAAAIGSVLQIRPVLRIDGERLDAFAKVRGSAACQKRLLSALADSVAEYAARWDDIDVAAASSCVDPAQNQLWHQTAQAAFPDYPVGYSPLAFSISSHVGPNARGLAVTRRLARTKAELEQRAAGK